jgi:hypothetical protein
MVLDLIPTHAGEDVWKTLDATRRSANKTGTISLLNRRMVSLFSLESMSDFSPGSEARCFL